MLIWLFLLFTVVPILELALLIELGGWLGLFPTVALVVGTGALGAWMARRQGLRALRSLHTEMAAGHMPGDALLDGLLILVGAVLLITPGVITDALGLALLLPPTRRVFRRLARSWAAKRLRMVAVGPRGFGFGCGTDGGRAEPFTPRTVIDADVVPNPPSPEETQPRH